MRNDLLTPLNTVVAFDNTTYCAIPGPQISVHDLMLCVRHVYANIGMKPEDVETSVPRYLGHGRDGVPV
jgi:hypothetical protein